MEQLRVLISNWLNPKPVSNFKGFEVYRCQTDGGLILDHSCPSEFGHAIEHDCPFMKHAGHYLKSPVILTLKEKLLIWMNLLQ